MNVRAQSNGNQDFLVFVFNFAQSFKGSVVTSDRKGAIATTICVEFLSYYEFFQDELFPELLKREKIDSQSWEDIICLGKHTVFVISFELRIFRSEYIVQEQTRLYLIIKIIVRQQMFIKKT